MTGCSAGRYHMPNSIPHEAANLIKNCIVVNPIKRLTMPEIMRHPWFLAGLPKYLQVAPQTPSLTMHVESLSYILAPPKEPSKAEPSRLVQEVVEELAELIGVHVHTITDSLLLEGDNAIKVAYNIAKDKRMKSLDCEFYSPVSPNFNLYFTYKGTSVCELKKKRPTQQWQHR